MDVFIKNLNNKTVLPHLNTISKTVWLKKQYNNSTIFSSTAFCPQTRTTTSTWWLTAVTSRWRSTVTGPSSATSSTCCPTRTSPYSSSQTPSWSPCGSTSSHTSRVSRFIGKVTFWQRGKANRCSNFSMQWIVPQMFKRHIFFDLVIRFITNRKYAFFCIF